jgi:hypothetical protein
LTILNLCGKLISNSAADKHTHALINEGATNVEITMLQQAIKSEQPEAMHDVIEERSQPVSLLPKTTVRNPAQISWPHWNGIFSQLAQTGFPMMKSHAEMAEAGQHTIAVLAKSGASFTDAVNEINQHMIALTHKSITANLATNKKVFDIKTLSDWVEIQSKWVSYFINSVFTETTKLSELTVKVIGQASEPVQAHIRATLGKN